MNGARSENFIRVQGVRLRVVSEGEGRPVLVLHGFTGSAESMECVCEGLRAEFRVHRVDLPGHGQSDAPTDLEPFRISSCVAQLCELLDAMHVSSTLLIGYSMGGRVALSLALARPERVAALVLIGATPGIAQPAERMVRRRNDEELADRIVNEGLERFVDDWMAQPLFATQARLSRATLARERAQRLSGSAHGFAQSLRGMGTGTMPARHADLHGLEVPVLCVVGEEDKKFHAIAEKMVESLPRARLCSIVKAGHAAHLERPRAFAMAVRDFFDSLPEITDAGGLS